MNPESRLTADTIIEQGRYVLEQEAMALRAAVNTLDDSFAQAVNLILNIQGRVIVTGMGKPGYIAHKTAATLASTGTPAFFLHPAEGAHGDLGMVTSQDVVLAISNSGETAELINILPVIKRIGASLISICGDPQSTLVRHSDVFISAQVSAECCPLNLAPTSSTTLALALGDALAVALMHQRAFKAEDFALYHPGGALGRRLLLTVGKVMRTGLAGCCLTRDKTILDALFAMTSHLSGAAVIVDEHNHLQGIVTDGDIRRYVMHNNLFMTQPVTEIMKSHPLTIYEDCLVDEAIRVMEQHKPAPVTVLPVLNRRDRVCGLIHITDMLSKKVI
ncbi:arabinose-5-phosphate isomerase [Salmonella enterica subsp. enterica serovar Choleraesuis]|nr:arabinose-5-phosphate isomerase [Salmonella enterica subsp. enterica serovar Choleraesuis]